MKKIISTLAIMALVSSCTNEMEDNTITGDYNNKITLTAKPFVLDDEEGAATRSVLTRTETSLKFSWKDGEAIGVFPVSPTTNIQAKKTISVTGEGSLTADFDGEGWELKRGNTYSAYSPFNGKMPSATPYKSVPFDMEGQMQIGNANLAHIGDQFDYMYASCKVPTNGNVNFEFDHACAIGILELTMPEAGTWTLATLVAESAVFISSGTMDISTGKVSVASKSDGRMLYLDNVSTTAPNQKLTLYMSILPCTTGPLTLKIKNSSGKEYKANLASKTMVAGRAYKWTYSWAPVIDNSLPANAAAVDLGLSVKWANMNVGATSATGYGTYFAWGEVTGCQYVSDEECIPAVMDGNAGNWSSGVNPNYVNGNSKSDFGSWTYYKWYDGSTYYKYTASTKTTLESSDDAAVVNWGGDWRMPTVTEQEELCNNCYWVWTDSYNGSGIKGYIVYKAKNTSDKGVTVYSGSTPSSNYSLTDNHIFLPCAGGRDSSSFVGVGSFGYYWSSSLYESIFAWYLGVKSGSVWRNGYNRYYGFPIRAVCQ